MLPHPKPKEAQPILFDTHYFKIVFMISKFGKQRGFILSLFFHLGKEKIILINVSNIHDSSIIMYVKMKVFIAKQ